MLAFKNSESVTTFVGTNVGIFPPLQLLLSNHFEGTDRGGGGEAALLQGKIFESFLRNRKCLTTAAAAMAQQVAVKERRLQQSLVVTMRVDK